MCVCDRQHAGTSVFCIVHMWAGKVAEAELRIKLWVLTPSVPDVVPAHLHMDICKGNFSNAIQMHS